MYLIFRWVHPSSRNHWILLKTPVFGGNLAYILCIINTRSNIYQICKNQWWKSSAHVFHLWWQLMVDKKSVLGAAAAAVWGNGSAWWLTQWGQEQLPTAVASSNFPLSSDWWSVPGDWWLHLGSGSPVISPLAHYSPPPHLPVQEHPVIGNNRISLTRVGSMTTNPLHGHSP